ncbi:MAG: ANTAR domain-containing protein [Clostridia bacterium]|nr:ANTAR domain-containing protein [Clostridia bacterium]
MPPEKRCYSVLVISGKKQNTALLSAMLDSSVYRPVDYALSVGEAKRKLLRNTFDILIIDPPLPDGFGADFALDATADTHSGILMLVRSDLFASTCLKVEDAGVLTLAKPVSKNDFYTALKLITATSARLLNEEKKTRKLQDKLDEIKLVSRAKIILMEKRNISEPEAHRYIEKEAMDTRQTRKEIAKKIIES